MKQFFILSHGRTGTNFLAKLLNGCNGAVVHHEPRDADKDLVFYSYSNSFSNVLDGLLKSRFKSLLENIPSSGIYGECNSYLRYEGAWLKQHLDATVIYVCRDGRDFVKSAYPRKLYTELEAQLAIIPDDRSPFAADWHNMTRFDRICWYWADTYNTLWDHSQGNIHHVEDLLTDYEKFKKVILLPTGLSLSESDWKLTVQTPENSTSSNLLRKKALLLLKGKSNQGVGKEIGPWKEWSASQKKSFETICGETMEKLGYEIV